MRYVAVIDNKISAESFTKNLEGCFDFSVAESKEEFSAGITGKFPDAVVVNADFAGEKLQELVRTVRSAAGYRKIPIVFFTKNNSSEWLSSLCDLGADDVFVLPLCRELIVRRLNTLTDAYGSEEKVGNDTASFDFDEFIEMVSEKNIKGAFCVRQNEFTNLYRFIIRGLDRSRKSVQVIMLTLNCNKEHELPEEDEKVMKQLSEAVQLCLRRGDISTVCSKNQVVILLVGADDDGGHLVANRILSSFYSECDDDSFELLYDIREVNINK